MIDTAILVPAALAVAAPLGLPLAYRTYSAEQRAAAGALWHAYVAGLLAVSVVGILGLAAVGTRDVDQLWTVAGSVVVFPLLALQYRMHVAMDYTGWFGTR